MPSIQLIVAASLENGIGINGGMPWRLRKDMSYFQHLTTKFGLQSSLYPSTDPIQDHQNYCIMGRKTWDSIPSKFRPLKDRTNIVLSRSFTYLLSNPRSNPTIFPDGSIGFSTLDTALEWCKSTDPVSTIWIIGGGQIYDQSFPLASRLFLTRVRSETPLASDTFLDMSEMTKFRRLDDGEIRGLLGIEMTVGWQREGEFEFEFQVWERV